MSLVGSQYGVVPLHWASLTQTTHALVLVLQYGVEGVVEQFASPRHCVQKPAAVSQYGQGGEQFPSEVQVVRQAPFWQAWPTPQAVPQEPQFAVLLCRFTQTLPHST